MPSEEREAYVVATSDGYLGQRRYSYKEGTTRARDTDFKYARIFTRRSDAEGACGPGDCVAPVAVRIK